MKYVFSCLVAMLFVACTTTPVTPYPVPPGPSPIPAPTPAPTPISVIGCDGESLVTDAAVAAIATLDSCSNTAVMTSDIQNLWGPANLCSMIQQTKLAQKMAIARFQYHKRMKFSSVKAAGPISSIVCPFVVSTIDNFLNSTPTAVRWGCTGSQDVDAVVGAACTAIPL